MTHRVEIYEKTFAGRESFIAQHRFSGVGVVPASVQLEMAILGVVGRQTFTQLELTEVAFVRPLTVADDGAARVRLNVTSAVPKRFELSVVTDDGPKAVSTGAGRPLPADVTPVTPWEVSCPVPVDPERLYASWSGAGLEYGPDFRTVRRLTVDDGLAEAVLHSAAQPLPWYSHPLLVDGVFQVVSCALQDLRGADGPHPMLPIGIGRLRLLAELPQSMTDVTVRVRRTSVEGAYSVADAIVLGPSGEVLVEFSGIRMRRVPADSTAAPGPASRLVTRIHWAPGTTTPAARTAATGTWVVLHDGDLRGAGGRTVQALRAEGARVVEVLPRESTVPGGESGAPRERRVLSNPDEAAFRRLWADIADPIEGVVHLWNTGPAGPVEAELRTGLYSCLAAIKTLGERQRKGRFVVATENAQPVTPGDLPVAARAALWGLIRTAAIEYPGLRPRLVDLDAASGEALTAELGDGPVEIGYRAGVRYEPARVPVRPADAGRSAIRRGGRYLILGGHGALGLAVAARFARDGAGLVALVSRSGGSGADREAVAAIEAQGCAVASFAVDATAPGALSALVEQIRGEFGDLHGVVHAAGTLRDGLIRSATADDVAAVLRPKVDAARELASAVTGRDLDFAVLFASVSGTFGNLGQGGYAAANAYLDGFAHAEQGPWISIDWGLWGEIGMGTAVAEQLRRRGVQPLGTTEALDALMAVLRTDVRQVVIAHPDVEPAGAGPKRGPAATAPTDAGPDRSPADRAAAGSAIGAQERAEDELARFMTERLGLTTFDRSAPLTDYGMNSILSVELSEELSRRWNTSLPATLFLEYGDFAELANALHSRYGAAPPAASAPPAVVSREPAPTHATPVDAGGPAEPARSPATGPRPTADADASRTTATTSPATPALRPADRSRDIAVVAVSGDLPGAANLAEFWSMLRGGADAFTEIPAERWDIEAHFQERGPTMTGTYCRTGAFLSEIDRLDPKFFGVSVREAEEMDPQQKLLLEHAWSVIDESGLAGHRDIGVFVGATYTHHRDAQGLDRIGPHTALGSMNAVLANRISYAFDLTGPSQTVDTLCSSSLVAVQQAVHSLRAGQCGAAIVAACHVGLTPWYYRSLSQLGALSQTRPRPFDEQADGFIPGEGAIAVMLKPLDAAERDGDRIWGVIRGAAVNHGGRASALPVPRSESQAAVIRAALADAGVPAADISLIETHGTATRLGDPIELAALAEVFDGDPHRDGSCFIGSVKANIGHLEPASGLAGLVKILLCMHHQEIPPLAGFENPGAHIDLSSGLFVVPTESRPWRSAGPRRAGISAFGMGGTNAHIVVEEYVARPAADVRAADPLGEHLLVLSAHTPHALARRVEDVERRIAQDRSLDAGVLCFSSAVGRHHLPHRVAVLGATADELGAGLRRVLHHLPDLPGMVVRGSTVLTSGPNPVDEAGAARLSRYATLSPERIMAELRAPDDRLLTGLAFLYVAGHGIDWRRVHDVPRAPRLVLPPYPFRGRAGAASRPATENTDQQPADIDYRMAQAHRVFGQETVPAALLIATAFTQVTALERMSLTARGVGLYPLTSDLAQRSPAQTTTFRHGDRVIAYAIVGGPVNPELRPAAQEIGAVRARYDRRLEPAGLYAWFAARGMDLAAPLTAITGIHFGTAGVLAEIGYGTETNPRARAVAAIDAALQSMAVLTLADPAASPLTYLPVSIGRLVRWADPAQTAFVHLHAAVQDADGTRRCTVTLLNADGHVLVSLEDVVYRPVSPGGAATTAGQTPAVAPSAPRTRPNRERVAGEQVIVELVRRVLRDPDVTATGALSDTGMDSMLATLVAAEINDSLGVQLSPTDVLDARDCRALAAVVTSVGGEGTLERAAGAAPDVEPQPPVAAPVPTASVVTHPTESAEPAPATPDSREIAVIGLSCALPGAAEPRLLWSMLSQGVTGVGPAPAYRWSGEAGVDSPPVGGFLENVDEFDAHFFDFFPKQAEVLDPQARWVLRTAWEALESAGIPPLSVSRSTGVFVGASYQHYKDYNIEPELDAPSGLGNHNAFIANRVSYFLDLSGPSMTIDTLCSSSLVALHTAVRSIRDGECEQAIVSGVRLAMSPLHYHAMKSLRALSPTGASRAFDASADGFVPGEGVVTVVLKPLRDAVRDGDRIRAVIKGTAVNHGGRTSGLTVPSSAGQREVIRAALRDAGVDPGGIQMVEAHGTGTGLGDPIEVDGLVSAWREFTDRRQFCAIGSVKSNIGHLEPAAGLAGLVKVVLALEHGVIPPTLHVSRPNDHIRFEDSPFYVVDRAVSWPRGEVPRRAAVSAFGMGGVNAHVIVEEPPLVAPVVPVSQDSFVVRVSGASEDAVRVLAGAYADRFATASDDRETADLCHTANVGRSSLDYQTAVRGRTGGEIAEALRAVAAGHLPVVRVDSDATAPVPEVTAGSMADRHAAVVDAVRRGHVDIDWLALSAPGSRIVDLPGYPFARARHWRDRAAAAPAEQVPAGPATAPATEALRTRWQVRDLPPSTPEQRVAVRVVAAEQGTAALVAAALRDLGADVVDGDQPAGAVVVVDDPATDTDPDLGGFWVRLRALIASVPPGSRVLWAGQFGAAVHPEERARLLPEAAARAMAVRAACAENRCAVAVLDLDPQDPAGSHARQIAAEFTALRSGTDLVVAYRRGVRFAPEQVAAQPGAPVRLSADGYYLVTGGLGAVGCRLAEHLVAHGARRLAIIGRSVVDVANSAVLRELGQRAEVDYLPCDVADEAALTAALARFGQRWGQLRGIVHSSGGVNPFGSLRRREWADAARVTAPKVAGSRTVVRLAKARGAAFVVLVSSIAGTMPDAGRGLVDYAMANAYQLALAERESGTGTIVTAHAWPNWTGIGMQADASFSAAHSITSDQALAGFAGHLTTGGSVIFPGSVEPGTVDSGVVGSVPVGSGTPDPASAVAAGGAQPGSSAAPVPPAPAVTPVAAGRASTAMTALVRDAFLDVLGEGPGDRNLDEMGLDSLAIADLTSAIERRSGRTVDLSFLMRARTATDIAAWLSDQDGTTSADPVAAVADPGPAPASGSGSAPMTASGASALSSLLRPLLAQSSEH